MEKQLPQVYGDAVDAFFDDPKTAPPTAFLAVSKTQYAHLRAGRPVISTTIGRQVPRQGLNHFLHCRSRRKFNSLSERRSMTAWAGRFIPRWS